MQLQDLLFSRVQWLYGWTCSVEVMLKVTSGSRSVGGRICTGSQWTGVWDRDPSYSVSEIRDLLMTRLIRSPESASLLKQPVKWVWIWASLCLATVLPSNRVPRAHILYVVKVSEPLDRASAQGENEACFHSDVLLDVIQAVQEGFGWRSGEGWQRPAEERIRGWWPWQQIQTRRQDVQSRGKSN